MIDTSNLGPNLIELINSTYKREKLIVIRNEWDEIMDLITIQKTKSKLKWIWYKKHLNELTINNLETLGYHVWNPKRGINYGKTWPGYRISWN